MAISGADVDAMDIHEDDMQIHLDTPSTAATLRNAEVLCVLDSHLCVDVMDIIAGYDQLRCYACGLWDNVVACAVCGLYACDTCRFAAFAFTICGGCGADRCTACMGDRPPGTDCPLCPYTEVDYDFGRCVTCHDGRWITDLQRCDRCMGQLCPYCATEFDDGRETLVIVCAECESLHAT